METVIEIPEEVFRRIEIHIFNEKGEVVFDVSGDVSRRTAHTFMEHIGHAFVPEEPSRPLVAIPLPMHRRISCEVTGDCTDYPTKCSKCDNNKAKSYFKLKEEST